MLSRVIKQLFDQLESASMAEEHVHEARREQEEVVDEEGL
jgi:hypothetical protein